MKRTLWLLLLTPAVAAAIWVSQGERLDAESLHEALYVISAQGPLTFDQLFPVPAQFTVGQPPLTLQDLLAEQGIQFPDGSSIAVNSLDLPHYPAVAAIEMPPPGSPIGRRVLVSLTNTAAHHHRFHQYLQHTLAPLSSGVTWEAKTRPVVTTRWNTIQFHRYFGAAEYLMLNFAESERVQARAHTHIYLGATDRDAFALAGTYINPSNTRIHWSPSFTIFPSPIWPLVFLACALPAIFIYVFRRPLGRMLRLPSHSKR